MKIQKIILYSLKNIKANVKEGFVVFMNEYKTIFRDRGVLLILLLAPVLYPLMYGSIYQFETLEDIPIAAVDASHSKLSNELLRHIDATRDVKILYKFDNLTEAKRAFEDRNIKGVVYIPSDFSKKIATQQTGTVAIYSDMSSFLYYRGILMACNYSVMDMNNQIKRERTNAQGETEEMSVVQADPIPYEGTILFNGGMGFASFLLPAILILVLHQTIFLGISMVSGSAREDNRSHQLVSSKFNKGGIYRVLFGKAMCYFLIYLIWVFFVLVIVPRIFNLPHIGRSIDIYKLMIPFLLATIFFSMSVSVFFPNRETGIVIFLFFSLILLFLSGISWPLSNMNGFWRAFRWIFPSTHGIQGYIKINSMGGDLNAVRYECLCLWGQTAIYFIMASVTYSWQIRRDRSAKSNETLGIPLQSDGEAKK